MLFQNGTIFLDGTFKQADVRIEGNKIMEISDNLSPTKDEKLVDLTGKWLLPGFFDVHTHGRDGADFSDAPSEELVRIQKSYAKCGVTSVLATTMTMEEEYSKQMMARIRKAIETDSEGAHIWGINMEGPFLGPDKKGCHDLQYLRKPDCDFFEMLDSYAGGHIALVDLDPNQDGAIDFIKKYSSTKKFPLLTPVLTMSAPIMR